MSMADWAEIEAMKYLFTAEVMGNRPEAWWVALHTADPSDTGASNEVVAAWYARKSVAFTRVNNSVSNTGVVTWSSVTGSQLTVTHASIKDAVSGGNTIAVLAIAAQNLKVNDTANIQAGSLTFSLD